MPIYAIDASLERDGYYIINPEDRKLSECQFVEAETQPKLSELQALVGGYIECVSLNTSPKLVGVIDEEGKMKGQPRNGLATALFDSPTDIIVGTMLVMCGKAILL